MTTAVKRIVIAICLLGVPIGASAERTESGVDPALVAALKQAVEGAPRTADEIDTMLWLAGMSEKLALPIPDPFYRVHLLRLAHEEAQSAGLDPELVLAVIHVESGFDRFAVSASGARGLMQIMPFWKKEIGHPTDDLFNPRVNLRYGCAILRYYLDRTRGRVAEALAAYNGSAGKREYVDKVYLSLRQTVGNPDIKNP